LTEQCGVVASTRQAARNHFNTTHGEFRCNFVGCHKAFGSISHLKSHEIVHLNLHPYRCKWPGCEKTCKVESNLISHIRGVHFKLPITLREQQKRGILDDRDPKEFVEVRHELP